MWSSERRPFNRLVSRGGSWPAVLVRAANGPSVARTVTG